jgi:hypothetical protein
VAAVLKTRSIQVREPIKWFSEMMERKCRTHDSDRGEQGWRGARVRHLLHRACEEYYEALLADHDAKTDTMSEDRDKLEKLLWECVDIANMAMMAADNVRLKMRSKSDGEG